MKDPLPQNISGQKSVSHVVEHRVRWDYLVLGVAAVYAVWKVARALETASSEGGAEVVDVPVTEPQGNDQVAGLRTEV